MRLSISEPIQVTPHLAMSNIKSSDTTIIRIFSTGKFECVRTPASIPADLDVQVESTPIWHWFVNVR